MLLCALAVPDERNGIGMPFLDWHVVDPVTGEATRLTEAAGEAPLYGQWQTQVDGDLVYVNPEDGTSRTLIRYDLTAEEVLWETALPRLSDDPSVDWVNGLVASGDLVVVLSAAGTVLLDGDGQVLEVLAREAALGAAPERLPLLGSAEHGVGLWTDPTTGEWFAPDGTRTATLDGRPLEIDVVGGSERVAVLRRDGDLVAVDVTTGAELWQLPAQGRARALLDGRLVVSERDRLAALDVRTGEMLWEVPLGAGVDGATSPTLTDGVRIGLAGQQDGRATLTTFDLASGRQEWQTRLPEGTRDVRRIGRAVVAIAPVRGGEDFVILR